MTFDHDMWPLTSPTNEGSHVASMTQLGWNPLKHVEVRAKYVKLFSQQQTTTTTDNNSNGQSDPYVSFLLRQATQKLPFVDSFW